MRVSLAQRGLGGRYVCRRAEITSRPVESLAAACICWRVWQRITPPDRSRPCARRCCRWRRALLTRCHLSLASPPWSRSAQKSWALKHRNGEKVGLPASAISSCDVHTQHSQHSRLDEIIPPPCGLIHPAPRGDCTLLGLVLKEDS